METCSKDVDYGGGKVRPCALKPFHQGVCASMACPGQHEVLDTYPCQACIVERLARIEEALRPAVTFGPPLRLAAKLARRAGRAVHRVARWLDGVAATVG